MMVDLGDCYGGRVAVGSEGKQGEFLFRVGFLMCTKVIKVHLTIRTLLSFLLAK